MRRTAAALVGLTALSATFAASAVQPDEMLKDPALEARARALSADIRCLVCQNQSIDDSDASLARDLRLLVREQIKQGRSDGEIREIVFAQRPGMRRNDGGELARTDVDDFHRGHPAQSAQRRLPDRVGRDQCGIDAGGVYLQGASHG